jgi:hypothetical protein
MKSSKVQCGFGLLRTVFLPLMKQLMSDDVYVDLMKGVRASDAERARGGTDAVLGTGRAMVADVQFQRKQQEEEQNSCRRVAEEEEEANRMPWPR